MSSVAKVAFPVLSAGQASWREKILLHRARAVYYLICYYNDSVQMG